MEKPEGMGVWIAFAGQIGGHEAAIDRCLELGAAWVAPRGGFTGTGGRDDHWSSEEGPSNAVAAIERYHKGGLKVYPWIFSRPERWKREVELFRIFMGEGADGVIIDAEIAWELSEHREDAKRMMTAIRTGMPSAFVADAPWPWEGVHPTFPVAEFSGKGTGCSVDAHMPQAYVHEIGRSAGVVLARMEEEWGKLEAPGGALAGLVLPRWPIFDTYSHVTKCTVEDMALCINSARELPVFSLYSVEAMDHAIRDFLRARIVCAPNS